MKKKLFTIGSLTILTLPVITTISCGEHNKKIPSEELKSIKPKTKETIDNKSSTKKDANINLTNILKTNQDGFYLVAADYNGEIRDNSLKNDQKTNKEKVKIDVTGYSLKYSVMLGDGDSIYMLYDNDDKDGLSPKNFKDTVFFEDTSVFMSNDIYAANKVLGNKIIPSNWGKRALINFVQNSNDNDGVLNTYIGGQNNHTGSKGYSTPQEFQKALKVMYKAYIHQPAIYKSILKYYGLELKQRSDGNFHNDKSIKNGASILFSPMVSNSPIFTYEWVGERAVKITYHSEDSWKGTAAHMVLKENGKYNTYGSFSIGDENEWSSYRKHDNAQYVGFKPEKAVGEKCQKN